METGSNLYRSSQSTPLALCEVASLVNPLSTLWVGKSADCSTCFLLTNRRGAEEILLFALLIYCHRLPISISKNVIQFQREGAGR